MSNGFGLVVNRPYVCVDPLGVHVRKAFQLDSPSVRKLRVGEIVHGVLTCLNPDGHLRLQLDDGTWTSVHAGNATEPFLQAADYAHPHYVCIDANDVNVRSGFNLNSPFVRKLASGDVVCGKLVCFNTKGHLRLQLDDGNWTSIHCGAPDDPFLRMASPVDDLFVCSDPNGVKLRRGFHLDSPLQGEIRYGDIVHGVLTCLNSHGHLRLRLDDGNWTSIHAGMPTEPFLAAATKADALYVCVDKNDVMVRRGFDLNSQFERRLRHGETVRGAFCCLNERGHLRLRLDDGYWTSIHAGPGCPPFLILAQPVQPAQPQTQAVAGQMLCQVCMDKPKNVAFNCGHQSCENCSVNLQACPYCRSTITSRIKLYP